MGASAQAATVGAAFGTSGAQPVGLGILLSGTAQAVFVTIGAAAAMRARSGETGVARLGLAFSIYPILNGSRLLALPALTTTLMGAMAFYSVGASLFWLRVRPRVTWALVAWGAIGLVVGVATAARGNANFDYGAGGVARTSAALLIALAILRGRLFGIEPPGVALRRGSSAVFAFAGLAIAAQIAENFISAQGGLLIGGVVAGILLIAIRPIERALERRQDSRAPQPDAAKEDAFRAAVRMALRDRVITREEELHLHRVAQHMGIPTGRAHELLIEVEREKRGP